MRFLLGGHLRHLPAIRPDYDLGESFKTFYLMQLYELLEPAGHRKRALLAGQLRSDRPERARGGLPLLMFVFRSAMAGAAWAKVRRE